MQQRFRGTTSAEMTPASAAIDAALKAAIVDALRDAGAKFAFAFGSRSEGRATEKSDVDVAAWWGVDVPDPWTVRVPGRVDLLVLDTAPLELAGRVAQRGVLLFDDDPPARVEWQATTRKIYLDEEYRQRQIDRDFFAGRARGR